MEIEQVIKSSYKHGGFILLMKQTSNESEPYYWVEYWENDIDITINKTKVETSGSLEKIRKQWRKTINIDYMSLRRVQILYPDNKKLEEIHSDVYNTNKKFYEKIKKELRR